MNEEAIEAVVAPEPAAPPADPPSTVARAPDAVALEGAAAGEVDEDPGRAAATTDWAGWADEGAASDLFASALFGGAPSPLDAWDGDDAGPLDDGVATDHDGYASTSIPTLVTRLVVSEAGAGAPGPEGRDENAASAASTAAPHAASNGDAVADATPDATPDAAPHPTPDAAPARAADAGVEASGGNGAPALALASEAPEAAPDDSVALSPRARALLAEWRLERDCRILARWYPHLVNRIAELWQQPAAALDCVRDLLDERSGGGKRLVTGARLDLAAIEHIAVTRHTVLHGAPVQRSLFDPATPAGADGAAPASEARSGLPDHDAVQYLSIRHPHIVQRLEALWDEPDAAVSYLDSLLFPEGRKRSGFSDDALRALWALKSLIGA